MWARCKSVLDGRITSLKPLRVNSDRTKSESTIMVFFYMQLWQAPSFIAKILSTLNILSLSWLIWILRPAQLTLRIPPLSPPVRPRERLRSPGSCNSLQLRSGHSRRQCCLALLPGRANALTASSKQLPAGTSADTLSPQQLLKAAAASLPASVAPASCSSSPGILVIL